MFKRLVALVLPLALATGVAGVVGLAPVQAYQGCEMQSSASVELVNVVANQVDTAQATFRDCKQGDPIVGARVTYFTAKSPGPNCQASFSPSEDITDAKGQVTFNFTLPPGCPGEYSLGIALHGGGTSFDGMHSALVETAAFTSLTDPANEVAAQTASDTILFTLFLSVREIGGFPNTTAEHFRGGEAPPSGGLLLVAGGLTLVAVGMTSLKLTRRRKRRRRHHHHHSSSV